jgi:hypothetical protein
MKDKTFSNALACFTIVKTHRNKKIENGIVYTSELLYKVAVGTKLCEYGFHLGKGFNKTVVKNGIEVLDPVFIKNANKTKKGKALIKQMMKI